LHTKLSRTATALRKWYKQKQKEDRTQEDISNEVIFQQDLAQEDRVLMMKGCCVSSLKIG
jgi:hypothetical protein